MLYIIQYDVSWREGLKKFVNSNKLEISGVLSSVKGLRYKMDGHLSTSLTINEEPSYLKPLEQGARKGVVTFTGNIPKRFSFSLKESPEETISVLLRIKPEDRLTPCQHILYNEKENSVTIKKSNKADHSYKYTHVFSPEANQKEVFEKSAKNKIQRLLDGLSSFIFTFGSSNSGKTFTVQGDQNNPGLLPRSLVALFNCLKNFIDVSSPLCPEQASSVMALSDAEISEKLAYKKRIMSLLKSMLPQISKTEGFIPYEVLVDLNLDSEDLLVKEQEVVYSVWLSFYEIYNEKIYDLLDEPREVRTPLRLVSDKNRMSYIKDLIYIQANSLREAYQIYLYGRYNLSVSSTAVNDRSSRSHSIFTIKLIGRPKNNSSYYSQHSSFSICDLAGTERANRTRNVGLRLKESQRINASFLVLNKCLRIIRENQSSEFKKLVPYRESKLTQILGPSLTSGEASLTMIVAISQNETYLEETMNTLKSSSVATSIVIHSPPRRKTERMTRFSMAISTCAPGESVGWKAIAASQLQGSGNPFKHPDGLKGFQDFKPLYPEGQEPDVYKELLEERKKVLELEAILSEIKENHRKEVEHLNESLKRKVSHENTEHLKKKIEEKEEACIEMQIELLRVRKKIRIQGEELEQFVKEKKDLEQLNTKLEELLNDAKEEVELLTEENNSLYEKSNSKDYLLALKEEEIEILKEDKNQLEDTVQTQMEELQNYEEQIAVLSRDFNRLKAEKKSEVLFFSKQLKSVQEENEFLKKRVAELEKDTRFQVPVIEISDSDYTPREVNSYKGTRKKANYVLRSTDLPDVKVEGSRRTRSADRRVYSSSEDDPEFLMPHSTGTRSTVKKRTKTKKQLPEYFEDNDSHPGSESSTSIGTKKQLFLRSSEFLNADNDLSKFDDLNQTQASPETIITRTLRARKK